MKVETERGRTPAGLVAVAAALLALCLYALPAGAGERGRDAAGDFTHYVLALSWHASWCALEGDARGAAECDASRDRGFTLHGLWPQGEDGWPESCRTGQPDPSRAQTAAMADIMGSGGLAWYEWKKHGRCSGLAPTAYFTLARDAYESIRQPEVLTRLTKTVRIAPAVVEEAFLKANPRLTADELAVTCKDGMLQEVRICLTPDLAPRPCTQAVERGCRSSSVTLPPAR